LGLGPSRVLLGLRLGGAPLASDQAVEPRDLALALVQPVVHQLDGVGVHALAGCPHRGAQVGQPLLEVATPPLELVYAAPPRGRPAPPAPPGGSHAAARAGRGGPPAAGSGRRPVAWRTGPAPGRGPRPSPRAGGTGGCRGRSTGRHASCGAGG